MSKRDQESSNGLMSPVVVLPSEFVMISGILFDRLRWSKCTKYSQRKPVWPTARDPCDREIPGNQRRVMVQSGRPWTDLRLSALICRNCQPKVRCKFNAIRLLLL